MVEGTPYAKQCQVLSDSVRCRTFLPSEQDIADYEKQYLGRRLSGLHRYLLVTLGNGLCRYVGLAKNRHSTEEVASIWSPFLTFCSPGSIERNMQKATEALRQASGVSHAVPFLFPVFTSDVVFLDYGNKGEVYIWAEQDEVDPTTDKWMYQANFLSPTLEHFLSRLELQIPKDDLPFDCTITYVDDENRVVPELVDYLLGLNVPEMMKSLKGVVQSHAIKVLKKIAMAPEAAAVRERIDVDEFVSLLVADAWIEGLELLWHLKAIIPLPSRFDYGKIAAKWVRADLLVWLEKTGRLISRLESLPACCEDVDDRPRVEKAVARIQTLRKEKS